ncbi:MAG TPA: hypothetical protein VGB84_00065 [Arachidicoccus sp.]
MSHTDNNYAQELEQLKNQDFAYNKVSSSRFLFYLQLFGTLIFFVTACYVLWTNRYQGKPDIEIQSSTLYTPVYK